MPDRPVTARTQRKQRSREVILESAARRIREKGISGAGVADVMQGAGLTVGGFYAHFASKGALIDETLTRTGRETRGRLFAGLDAKPVGDRAEVVLKRYLSAAHRDEPDQGCPLPAIVGEVATRAAEHREALERQLEAMAAELRAHLPAGAVPPRPLALGLIALMYGGLSLARALGPNAASDEMLAACRALGGLAARGGTRKRSRARRARKAAR
jgi:TetR/AcrR family transcriptional regulator, transcriptional repressor for nem operon